MYYYKRTDPDGSIEYIAADTPITDDPSCEAIPEIPKMVEDIPNIPEIPLSVQIEAISARQEFIEDCIAEMAMMIYA